jgi:hypothetical protein
MESGDDFEVANWARASASKMFMPIGVRLAWHSDLRVCRQSPDRAIIVTFSQETPAGRLRGALAYSLPYEGVHIEVFFDRIRRAPEPARALLLAHVLVHEITHLLQGTDRHSDSGVMKAHWDRDDFGRMTRRSLGFTQADVMLIRQGVDARISQGTPVVLTRLPAGNRD